jgi:hypothetical protein
LFFLLVSFWVSHQTHICIPLLLHAKQNEFHGPFQNSTSHSAISGTVSEFI